MHNHTTSFPQGSFHLQEHEEVIEWPRNAFLNQPQGKKITQKRIYEQWVWVNERQQPPFVFKPHCSKPAGIVLPKLQNQRITIA